ncbi:hypothetical protein M426DRAFT_326022 [Hypoxylon sp. CI-4A]|nr:hypothetical protein M426DRAFT_326022 [Hypoxylon sp. CI-4A]
MDAAGLAITVAGSVLKLVAFSLDFIRDGKEIYHNGATDRNIDLALVANSIRGSTKGLEDQLDQLRHGNDERIIDPIETDLLRLAERARTIGGQLASILKKAEAKPRSKSKTPKAVLRGMWDTKDIEAKEKQLNGI